MWRTLAQFHTFVEIEFMPVYKPSEEEIQNPKLFARNVQQLMAKWVAAEQRAPIIMSVFFINLFSPRRALNLPVLDYAFDDCKLMEYAEKCKLFFAAKIADVAKFRQKLG